MTSSTQADPRAIRAEDRSGWDSDAERLEPEELIRWFKQLLQKMTPEPPDDSTPPEKPEEGILGPGDDDDCYYYYFSCPDDCAPDIDISYHEGRILIRIRKERD